MQVFNMEWSCNDDVQKFFFFFFETSNMHCMFTLGELKVDIKKKKKISII